MIKLKKMWLFVLILVFGFTQNVFCGGDSKNHGALFLGTTTYEGSSAFSLGFDYEYRLNETYGVGGLAEFVFQTGYTQTIIGIPIFEHYSDLKFVVIPAMEFYSVLGESKSYFLLRTGVAYDFHAGSISISPGINFDFVNSKTLLVSGVSFGFGF